jgi:hypothetical protein
LDVNIGSIIWYKKKIDQILNVNFVCTFADLDIDSLWFVTLNG